jgi:hypothetical protein
MSTTKHITYVTVAITTLRDLGTIEAAARYCERVAAQNGVDAMVYKLAAESLRDAQKVKVQS